VPIRPVNRHVGHAGKAEFAPPAPANTHDLTGRWYFGAGAGLASLAWFAALGYGARLLGRAFARPLAWRILDALGACTMITLGIRLLGS
jgi:L-lysine exporter family protein LysE/ArgO